MIELNNINPIGIGTYKLDLRNKDKTLKSLLYSVSKGQNFMSTSTCILCIKNTITRNI